MFDKDVFKIVKEKNITEICEQLCKAKDGTIHLHHKLYRHC